MQHIFAQAFGARLERPTRCSVLPSPKELMGKVLLKGKVMD